MSQDLKDFIKSNPDPRELKRALAVKLSIKKLKYKKIAELLQVSFAFISKWKKAYTYKGIEGLKLRHQGSKSFLTKAQKQELSLWIEQNQDCKSSDLQTYIQIHFKLNFSKSSCYRFMNILKEKERQRSRKTKKIIYK